MFLFHWLLSIILYKFLIILIICNILNSPCKKWSIYTDLLLREILNRRSVRQRRVLFRSNIHKTINFLLAFDNILFLSLDIIRYLISIQILKYYIVSGYIVSFIYHYIFYLLIVLHFFQLLIGVIIIYIVFWAQFYQKRDYISILKQIVNIYLFYDLNKFYWHFLELLWLFILLVLYLQYK